MKYFWPFTVKSKPKNSLSVKFSSIRYISIVVLTAVFAVSCSNKKDGTSYRAYHNMTAYYNGYFNANELVKKGEKQIKVAHKEDYDKVLPIFIIGDETTAKASYPDMEKAIEKCETVIRRHTIKADNKGQKRPEYNKWIDENYAVIGKSYFYKRNYAKSAEVFNYVNRKYKNPQTGATSNTWLAKTLVQQEEYGKAIQALNKVDPNHKDISSIQKAEYYLAYTDVLLHQGKTDKAVEKLELAIKNTKKKKDKARLYFILAQIHQEQNNSSDALANYEKVIKSKPVYELEFYARINKALSYSRQGGSSAEIQKQLMKMLKDEKNKDYRDQIYYALGDVAWEEHRRADAITFYQKSLEENLTNRKQKAKTFLRLADLYFDERQYASAQLYYDSTLTTIDATHDRYGIVKMRAESLTELVAGLNAIQLYDSLGVICKLEPNERDKRLAEIQQQMQAEKDEQRRRDELAAQKAAAAAAAAANNSGGGGSGITGNFWAYNENLRKKGYDDFKEKWGDRPLKDNWRLQSLLSQSFGPGEEQINTQGENKNPDGTPAEENKVTDKYTAPSIDDLKASLPCEDAAQMLKIEKDAAEGYYNAGVVYKEKLNDEDNALSTWEELIANIDSSSYHPTTYYQLFRTWLSKENSKGYVKNPFCSSCGSQYWGDEIKRIYPGSEWAMLVDNPNYLDVQDVKRDEEEAAYQVAYSFYTSRNYPQARAMADTVINTQPNNHLICKYRLMRAICTGYSDARYGSTNDYQKELADLVKACPGSEEATKATELLKAIKTEEKPVIPSNDKTDESNSQPTVEDPVKPLPENLEDNPYKYDANAEHYIAVIMPVVGSDLNAAKTAIADFNTIFYGSASLKVTNNLLSKDNHLILIKSYKALDEGKEYVKSFKADKDKLKSINDAGYRTFLISKQNYITLFKNKDVDQYIDFYMVYYPQ